MITDLEKHSDVPCGVSLPLPGADVIVARTKEFDVSVGCGGTVLHGIAPSLYDLKD